MADVFLSYSSKDRAAAQKVQEALTARGIDVFWDQATPPGQDWDTWIRTKLANCKVAIVLWSRESVKSDNVRHEALVARKAKKLLPAMIDPIEAEDLPMGLYIVQATSLTDWRNADSAGMARLVAEVENRVGRRTPGATPVAATAQPARKINWVGVAIGVVLVAGATALTQWIYSPKQSPVSPEFASMECPNGLPRLSTTGECVGIDPGRVLTPAATCLDGSAPEDGVCDNGARPIPPAPVLGAGGGARAQAGESFANRIVGRWNWDGLACEQGPNVTLENGQLVFTSPGSRHVHAIEGETGQETRTRVLEPQSEAGEQYVLSPEYFATSDLRSFNLVVENQTTGTRNTWSPC
jgi:hypothetical protein